MNLNKCVLSLLMTLDPLRERFLTSIENMEYCPTEYKKNNTPPQEGYKPYHGEIILDGVDAHYWIHAKFKTPSIKEGEHLVLRTLTGRETEKNTLNPQGILYLNGKMVQGLDTNHTDAYLEPNTDYEAYNYFYVGMFDIVVGCQMSLYAIDERIERLYYDIKVPYDSCQLMGENSDAYIQTMPFLVKAARMIDLRQPYSEEFYRSIEEATRFMEEEFYGKVCTTEGKPIVWCVGHTHIDVEWKWTREQTREKIQRSFSTAKALMDRYPEYQFTLSQPELYRYLKEEAPEKYEELKTLVAEGRWEAEGAAYLEPDCNLTGGESLIRQILFGKKFFRKEFGVESKVLFLPDVFGYSAALPQILKKSGVDHFVTSKISWNDTNKMPYDAFYWEGIDGTEIFTTFITAQEFGGTPGFDKQKTTYCGMLTPSQVKGTWDRFGEKEYCSNALMTFGFGDGGGGPTKEMLETQRRLAFGLPGMPATKMGFLRPLLEENKSRFDAISKESNRRPKWVGELYLEYHRGTYTSISKIKKNNRRAEFLLNEAEGLSVMDLYFGGCYDTQGFEAAWRKTLHNQFHDILPGSSIGAIYNHTDEDYRQIFDFCNAVTEEKLSRISSKLQTNGGTLLYNPTCFERRAITLQNGYLETDETVPPFGWKVLHHVSSKNRISIEGMTAENDEYRLTLNTAGQIASLFDKRAGREVFKSFGNALTIFEDHPTKYDAWEIEDYYKLKKYPLNDEAKITPFQDGSTGGFIVERQYLQSKIRQTIRLYSKSRRIDFETDMDWHEHHQILKAEFPFDIHSMNITCDVQFGHVCRPTHENTGWDAAKFECFSHKWIDLAESGYGAALLNDCKYGYSAEGSTVSLTLLKCPTFPDPDADQGAHHFTYSLLPHQGDFREAGVIKEAYLLNQPLLEKTVDAQEGALPETFSFCSVDTPNAVITAVKKAEADDGLILRLYDSFDCKSIPKIKVPEGYTKAELCDMMENPFEKLEIKEGKIALPLSNFEIQTIKFSKQRVPLCIHPFIPKNPI